VYRYQRTQAESCKGNSAMEIRAASASAKFRQSNRTDKWIELTMQLFHRTYNAIISPGLVDQMTATVFRQSYDTVPVFTYTDQLLCQCFHLL